MRERRGVGIKMRITRQHLLRFYLCSVRAFYSCTCMCASFKTWITTYINMPDFISSLSRAACKISSCIFSASLFWILNLTYFGHPKTEITRIGKQDGAHVVNPMLMRLFRIASCKNSPVHMHSQINNYFHKYQQHARGCDPLSLVKYVSVCEAEWFSQPKRTL